MRHSRGKTQAWRTVICHLDGRVSETSTANIAIARDGTILTPPPADGLVGVSLRCAERLEESLSLAWQSRSLTEADLASADEILLRTSPNCILPGSRFSGRPVGAGRPSTIYQSLLAAWSRLVNLDIAAQARDRAESSGGSA